MNLYRLHSNPESLYGYDKAADRVPAVAWDVYEHDHDKLYELEHLLAKSAQYSYLYATDVLNDRFELGEKAIATSAKYSFDYAYDIFLPVGMRFELGEPAIATSAKYSFDYAYEILEYRFELGEPAIRGSQFQTDYEERFGVKL